jgi:long-chain fatty acid transport protein
MSVNFISRFSVVVFVVVLFFPGLGEDAQAQGLHVSGVGPINRSMGGAGTAAPLDAIGALNWNPGSISALSSSQLAFGLELIDVDIELTSNLGPGTSGDAGLVPIPSIGWAHHIKDSPLTIGVGVYGIGGFKNNQPSGNAILRGEPLFAKADFLQVAPTASIILSDTISVGIAPTVTIGELGLDPLGPSVITPAVTSGQGNRTHWGGGFQAGVYYSGRNNVQMGFTFKSPQWMEQFQFYTSPTAVPGGVTTFDLDLPMILSLGVGYTGICDWTFAGDFRYFAYGDTDGFRELGWENIFAAAFGAQRRVTDSLSVRLGVNFNEAPINSNVVALNAADPLIQRYNVSAGGTYRFTDNVDLNLAYVYLGRTSVTGPIPLAPPGATLTNEISAHSAIFGITVRY